MKQLKKTLLTLVALLAVTTGAWATEFTSLKVGDVLHAGDVINTGTNYTFLNKYLDAGMQPATVVRANIGTDDITESETGAYYLIKGNNNFYYGTIYGDEVDYDGGHWPVTATSDGIVVTAINPGGYTELTFAVHEAEPSSGPEVTWTAASKTGSFTMPGGNVTLEPDYYPQATAAEGAVTAATDAKATTDAPLVTIDETKLTGAKNLMYYVSTDATAPAYDAEGWTDVLPTAENYTEAATLNVWYYPVGTDEGTDGATATYSDGDICATALTVTLGAAPTYAVTLNAEGLSTDEAAAWKVAKGTDQPAAFPLEGVTKGTAVTVTYTGAKKVIGVKAEKKTAPASTPLDNTTTAWTAGTYAVPAGGLTYSDAITVSGDVTLTLTEGTTLTLNKGISLAEGATLTVEGNGTMAVNGTNESTASTVAGSSGTLVLTSGTLNATGGNGQSLTINWSTDDLDDNTGASGGVAINGNVTVSGGTVTATGGNGGNLNTSAIGGGTDNNHGGNGGAAISGSVTVNGGTWTATNGSNGTYTSNGGDLGCSAGTGGAAVAGTVTDNRN